MVSSELERKPELSDFDVGLQIKMINSKAHMKYRERKRALKIKVKVDLF